MSLAPPRSPKGSRTFVDRGGTFTDVVKVTSDGRFRIEKHRSDRAVVGELAEGRLVFGTTVATNALLEHKGVPCLLIVTEGFRDLVQIGDMTRPNLFDAQEAWPLPLCSEVIEIPGRISFSGEELEPIPEGVLEAISKMDFSRFDAVGIALIHSNRNPVHENKIAACLPAGLHCALGHTLSAEVDYLARIETTVLDAAISPLLQGALVADRIPPEARAIRSDGSLTLASQLRAPDAVLSGPAGGVLAVAAVAKQAGFQRAIGLDMGGTSTDVCRVEVGRLPRREAGHRVGGQRIRRPVLEVETIAAGGGSILKNTGYRLEVGPESAGASPGPACYGQGGPPTLSDAALALGLMDPDAFEPVLVPHPECIPGEPSDFVAIAREAMAAAIRRIATARGVALSDHALVSYGGAAGQHAVDVAKLVGISTVLVHPCASVLSAWGQSLASLEEQRVQAVWQPLNEVREHLEDWFLHLKSKLPKLGEARSEIALRYEGTDHSIVLDWSPDLDLPAAFSKAHKGLYGFVREGLRLEVVNLRQRSLSPPEVLPLGEVDPFGLNGEVCHGPVRLDSETTSLWIPEDWSAQMKRGVLFVEAQVLPPPEEELDCTPKGIALWSTRFMNVAEQGGEVLRRLGRSVNIRERLDFSCAVFDGQGRLVANAPHIPVHLGAMGATVRDLLSREPDPPANQAWLCNDPQAGGSHLPDLTVVTCVKHDGHRFFIANRAHHVDVGGLTPGSMPPHSTCLEDEGIVFRQVPLLENGAIRDLRPLLEGCRQPESVVADLQAQIAANHHAASALVALGEGRVLHQWMAHLHAVSSREVRQLIQQLPAREVRDDLDGHVLKLRLSVQQQSLVVDFSGTSEPHPGNLNAPPAVVRAAVLYGLRCLMGREFPLNEGALEPVRFILPENSMVNPPAAAAIVGGNVETSQRITDLFLRAVEVQAASQGTMNNLTFGASDWAYYETLGGGSGAASTGPGKSAVQVHMTNTRATDPEILETRLPLRVHQMAIRLDSGGPGKHRGGDGLIREIEVCSPAQVALLATRRRSGAPGLSGGELGKSGEDAVCIGGEWKEWSGGLITLQPGDRVRVETPGGGGWGKQERQSEDLSP